MPNTREHLSKAGRRGAIRRAILLTDKQLADHARHAANARWQGKTAEERKIERARGREPKPETVNIEPNAKAMAAQV